MSEYRLTIPQDLDTENLERTVAGLSAQIGTDEEPLLFDLGELQEVTPFTVTALLALLERTRSLGRSYRIEGGNALVWNKLHGYNIERTYLDPRKRQRPSFLEHFGERSFAAFERGLYFCAFQVEVLTGLPRYLFRPMGLKGSVLISQLKQIGSDSLPIVALLSFLVGLTLALQSANQLRQFGANVFIADLIAIGLTREMAPLMIGILLSGRTGAAITSEIATMVITEEMDALRGMAIEPLRFVILPKFLALVISQPLLTMLANLMGVLGGGLVGLFWLDLPLQTFFQRALAAVTLGDLMSGLMKATVFAWIIVSIGVYKGLNVGKGSEAVGVATTSSVVSSLFAIIITDCIFSFFFYF